ncbi:hypothetical protein DFP73DRAFT_515115 [Morchella snyderi]|nr:hypothetical protein DFP73DRAFT_515115 [Morchella snyderi]
MKFIGFSSAAVLCLTTLSIASPITSPKPSDISLASRDSNRCREPIVRKEWRSLTKNEKKKYLAAVQCLAKKKSTGAVSGADSIYDDFQGVHSSQTPNIHFVGHFLPWHRYFVSAYEKALREECGWTGGQPYWDWLIDSQSGIDMASWSIFDPKTGFGGNGPFVEIDESLNFLGIVGRTGGGCVQDGPFTFDKFKLSLGPSHDVNASNPHCLTRDFAEPIALANLVPEVIEEMMSKTTYGAFARRTEGEPSFDVKNVHGGGHFGVGGVLGAIGDAYNSPGDPLFYLHHANLDRIWWQWQQQDRKERYKDVSGPIVPFDYTNLSGGNVTLDFTIDLGKLGKPVPLSQIVDPESGTVCFRYDC